MIIAKKTQISQLLPRISCSLQQQQMRATTKIFAKLLNETMKLKGANTC